MGDVGPCWTRVGSGCPGPPRDWRLRPAPPPPASRLAGETSGLCNQRSPPPRAWVFLGRSSSEALSLENRQSSLPERAAGCLVVSAVCEALSWAAWPGPLGGPGSGAGPPALRVASAPVLSARGPQTASSPCQERLPRISPPGTTETRG